MKIGLNGRNVSDIHITSNYFRGRCRGAPHRATARAISNFGTEATACLGGTVTGVTTKAQLSDMVSTMRSCGRHIISKSTHGGKRTRIFEKQSPEVSPPVLLLAMSPPVDKASACVSEMAASTATHRWGPSAALAMVAFVSAFVSIMDVTSENIVIDARNAWISVKDELACATCATFPTSDIIQILAWNAIGNSHEERLRFSMYFRAICNILREEFDRHSSERVISAAARSVGLLLVAIEYAATNAASFLARVSPSDELFDTVCRLEKLKSASVLIRKASDSNLISTLEYGACITETQLFLEPNNGKGPGIFVKCALFKTVKCLSRLSLVHRFEVDAIDRFLNSIRVSIDGVSPAVQSMFNNTPMPSNSQTVRWKQVLVENWRLLLSSESAETCVIKRSHLIEAYTRATVALGTLSSGSGPYLVGMPSVSSSV